MVAIDESREEVSATGSRSLGRRRRRSGSHEDRGSWGVRTLWGQACEARCSSIRVGEIRWVRFSHACWISGSPFEDDISYSLTGNPRNCLLVVLRQNVNHSAIRMTHAIYAPPPTVCKTPPRTRQKPPFLDPAVDTPSTKGLRQYRRSPLFFCYLQDFLKWRDPDSNRGHHDFQSYAEAFRYADLPHR